MSKTMVQRVRDFKLDNPNIRWISGKWFKDNEELKDNRYFMMYVRDGVSDLRNFKRTFIEMYGEDCNWPQLKIVDEAYELIHNGYKMNKLAYPLNEKELKIINYLLVGRPQYAIFFYGVGGSGKTTICNIICQIFGRHNVCASNLIDIGRFNSSVMEARLFYDDDMGSNITDAQISRLKPMVTNGETKFEAKGVDPVQGKYRCKCLFCCNQPLKFDIQDEGMLRRIIYYSKNEKIKIKDPSLADKEYTYEELLDIVVAALSVDMTNWENDFKAETREILRMNNSVWLYGMVETYDTYVAKCDAAGIYAFSESNWLKIKYIFDGWLHEEDNYCF